MPRKKKRRANPWATIRKMARELSECHALADRFEAQRRAAMKKVDRFRRARRQNGTLLHPHFDDVRLIMAELMEREDARDLADSYRLACKMEGIPWTRR